MSSSDPAAYARFAPLLFIIPVVALIVWRNAKPRRLRVEAIWVRPAILSALAIVVLYNAPPKGLMMIMLCAAALAVGAGLGWLRGRMMRISVEPKTHIATVQGSPLAVLFILAIIGLRLAVNTAVLSGGGGLHADIHQVTDVLLLLGIGLVAAQGLEMWLRARRLITDSRALAGPDLAG